jgi:hypothetical protein
VKLIADPSRSPSVAIQHAMENPAADLIAWIAVRVALDSRPGIEEVAHIDPAAIG